MAYLRAAVGCVVLALAASAHDLLPGPEMTLFRPLLFFANSSTPFVGSPASITPVDGDRLLVLSASVSAGGMGSIVRINNDGSSLTTLWTGADFYPANGEAAIVWSDSLRSTAEVVGVSTAGGKNGFGYLWSFNMASKTLTSLQDFGAAKDGKNPRTHPFNHTYPVFYGTTGQGGENDAGTLWKYDLVKKEYSSFFSFPKPANGPSEPVGAPIFFIQGNAQPPAPINDTICFFSTRLGPTENGLGTISGYNFTSKSLVVLHTFNGTNGQNPTTSLVPLRYSFGNYGTVYGVTRTGGAGSTGGFGVIFSWTDSEGFKLLHRFGITGDLKYPSTPPVFMKGDGYNTNGGGIAQGGGNMGMGGIFCFEGFEDLYKMTYQFGATVTGKPVSTLVFRELPDPTGLVYNPGNNTEFFGISLGGPCDLKTNTTGTLWRGFSMQHFRTAAGVVGVNETMQNMLAPAPKCTDCMIGKNFTGYRITFLANGTGAPGDMDMDMGMGSGHMMPGMDGMMMMSGGIDSFKLTCPEGLAVVDGGKKNTTSNGGNGKSDGARSLPSMFAATAVVGASLWLANL